MSTSSSADPYKPLSTVDDEEAAKEYEHFAPEAEKQNSFLNSTWTFVSCFFMTVAGVLGVGILSLPVKVARSGFGPFLANFTLCLIIQWLVCLYTIDLLQRGTVLLKMNENASRSYKKIEEDASASPDEPEAKQPNKPKSEKFLSGGPDLHTLGNLFLNKYLRVCFDFAVFFHFIFVLAGYSLAGPTALGQLIYSPSIPYIISPWVIILTLTIIFGERIIKPVITTLTLAKGSLLLVLVTVVGAIGASIGRESVSDWVYIGQPFLVGTVALGGAVNVLPVIYSKLKPTEQNIRIFRFAVMFAVFVCFILNVLWTWFILEIVPQRTPPNTSEPSLEQAAKNGQISTYPLIEIIELRYPHFMWAGTMINVFIFVSIFVSYLTMAAALKHTLDGWVRSVKATMDVPNTFAYHLVRAIERLTGYPLLALQFALYALTFGVVLLIAQSSPKGFLVISETFVSSALNIETGVFIVLMMLTSNLRPNSIKVPVPMPRFAIVIFWSVVLYFCFAVLYNIATSIMKLFIAYEDMPF